MKYTIVSDKIGKVGDEFVPGAGTNIDALLAHGFIVSDKEALKSAKTKTKPKEK